MSIEYNENYREVPIAESILHLIDPHRLLDTSQWLEYRSIITLFLMKLPKVRIIEDQIHETINDWKELLGMFNG
jgi:hypothetical protein